MSKLTDIDLMLDANRSAFRSAQIEHLTQYGRYWQGPVTHDEVPVSPTHADNQDIAVAQSGVTWRGMLPGLAEAPLPFSAVCDEYQSTSGRGYLMTITTVMDDVTWVLKIDYGPGGFSQGWMQYVEIGSP